jgi:hypothetical protein
MGFADDQDVTFTKIPVGGPKINFDQTTYQLKSKAVFLNDVTYKLFST